MTEMNGKAVLELVEPAALPACLGCPKHDYQEHRADLDSAHRCKADPNVGGEGHAIGAFPVYCLAKERALGRVDG